jgi:UDP-GlcNAc:undecaprenyl-phosphate GlcNAc-1-phosphate transferase
LPDEARVLGAFVLALIAALAATPVAIRVAQRVGFYDRPVGYKGHGSPTPYLGGAAVLSAFLLGDLTLGGGATRLAPITGCALAMWLVGTLDDRFTVLPQLRVAVEVAAAAVLFGAGLGWSVFPSEVANFLLTTLWVVGLVNAFNLMDNMDGATSTIAALSALGAAVLALVLGDVLLAVLAVALCGALVGFLPYNLAAPSRIFLGDGGSMPIGFVVAAVIMALPLGGERGLLHLLAGVLLAGLPILDTTLVLVSRRRAGVSFLQGGRDHLTHRLRSRLPSARAVAAALAATQLVLCMAALAVTRLGDLSTVIAWSIILVAAAGAVTLLEGETWAPTRVPATVGAPSFLAASPPLAGRPNGPTAAATPDAPPPMPSPRTAPGPTGFEPSPEPAAATPTHTPPPPAEGIRSLEGVLIALTALAFGLSPLLYGFYDLSVWGPIALLLLAVLFGLVVARPAVPRPAALVSLGGLVGLWAWSLLSTTWAESADQALSSANRWMLYAALLAILVLLLRNEALGTLLLGCTTALVLALGFYQLGAMVLGEGPSLFLGPRLNDPVGYINGQAAYLVLGIWPLVALAERARSSLLSGTAVASTVLLAALMVLCQSRAVVPALVVSALVLLVLVRGRARRAWVLVAVAAGVALLARDLLGVYLGAAASGGAPSADVLQGVAVRVLGAAALVGVVWGVLHALVRRMAGEAGSGKGGRMLAVASTVGLVAIAGVGAVTLSLAIGDPVSQVSRQIESFTSLGQSGAGTAGPRFASAGGNRYEYWRVAVNQFRAEPLKGVGAGNYDRTYFAERRIAEDVRQAHSIELQALGELGLVGGLALLIFVGGVLAGFVRRAEAARTSTTDAGMAVAGGGMFIAWLVHTSVDWLHLIPGLTGIALCGAAVLLAPWVRGRSGPQRTVARRAVVVACALLVVFAAAQLGRSTLAERNLEQGRAALAAGDPARALAESEASLSLNGESLPAHYLRAAALAQADEYALARATLNAATALEPHDFVPPALLGDIAVRRGDLRQARRDYGRAAALNPRDATLARLARDPRVAGPR